MIELEPDYLNKIANQLIVISSLLSGFSIAVLANLLVSEGKDRLSQNILRITAIAAASFLITVFAMTKIVMMTTEGYPLPIDQSSLNMTKIIGFACFFLGILTLSVLISLSGWTKSKRLGIFTTVVGTITFVLILVNL